MNESDKIILAIIEEIYPEWIERKKSQYSNLEGYDKYKKVVLDVFGYDIERAVLEVERSTDFTDLERKLEFMKLSKKLKEEEKKKKKK